MTSQRDESTHRFAGRSHQRIRVLRDDVVKKIAAGEIIDRPYSIVRELLDNSLDAESSEITLVIERGGLSRVRVIDNGLGMDKDDLGLCYLAHSTSKILEEHDLRRVTSLGFRGEALSSIGICGRLEITSKPRSAPHANRLIIQNGEMQSLQPSQGNDGAVVDVTELFASMPVRKQFLKSVSAETTMCRSTFIDRAIAFPGIDFRFVIDDRVRDKLPAQGVVDRIITAYTTQLNNILLHEVGTDEEGIHLRVVLGEPDLNRRDRKFLQLFINKRRVQNYSLQQAAEYAYSGYLPGGLYPVVFIFLEMDPALIDFNVHPTKREVRIRDLSHTHRMITDCISRFLSSFNLTPACHPTEDTQLTGEATIIPGSLPGAGGLPGARALPHSMPVQPQPAFPPQPSDEIRYLGQIFGVFLLAEWKESFFIIDQHAAHEKILYERFKRSAKEIQDLLFPVSFDTSPRERDRLLKNASTLSDFGINIEQVGDRTFEIVSLSSEFLSIEEGELVGIIKNIKKTVEQLEDEILKLAACHAAVKEGDPLDSVTARELVRAAFNLENARCPHGRPIWHHLSRDDLYRLVDRM